jgi:(E)-4-hydroxy-3-methylbut-2-enyl-diphosphate synthase
VEVDEHKAAEGAAWLEKIENENAGELTPERLAKLEAEQARAEAMGENGNGAGVGKAIELPKAPQPKKLDETVSPTAGRRFTRA